MVVVGAVRAPSHRGHVHKREVVNADGSPSPGWEMYAVEQVVAF